MKKIDEYYIAFGFAWLIFGMLFGMWLGATENRQFANSHAHANLVGFTLSVLFGLIYRFFPAMKLSRLAKPQFWIYVIGTVLFVAGKILVDSTGNADLVKLGSIIVFAGAVLMVVIFFKDREPAHSRLT